jgi:hypothetical protein
MQLKQTNLTIYRGGAWTLDQGVQIINRYFNNYNIYNIQKLHCAKKITYI